MSEILMQIQYLTKKFPVKDTLLTACDNINLDIKKGETLGIVGESGCGKSTLVKTILNIHKPTSGKIIFHDQDLTKMTGETLRQSYRKIQMVFQDPTTAFNPKMKIAEIICEPLLNFNLITKDQVISKAKELLSLVDLPEEYIHRYPHNMSGGQRQRVAIARALALEPEIIVCDEATSALDVSVQDKIIQLLVKLQKEKNITYIFICHDLALVSSLSHTLAIMYLGNIVEVLPAEQLVSAKHPYTKALLKAVFSVLPQEEQSVQTLSGEIPSPLEIPIGCPFQNRCPNCMEICRRTKPVLTKINDQHSIACHLL